MEVTELEVMYPDVEFAEDDGTIFAIAPGFMVYSPNIDDVVKALALYYKEDDSCPH